MHDHRLQGPVDLFIDESGPRAEGTLTLGVVIVESGSVAAVGTHFDRLAAALERDHPALKAKAYEGEWKGRQLARDLASTKEKRAVGRGELLSGDARQAVYARILHAIAQAPDTRALALTYKWSGGPGGPEDQPGYRVKRAAELLMSALAFQVVETRHVYIDDGHAEHYTAGILSFAERTLSLPVPLTFLNSKLDRRIQAADLVAFAAHTARFAAASAHVFPTAHSWLDVFVGPRVIRAGSSVDHNVSEP